jgi:hypothetical protein
VCRDADLQGAALRLFLRVVEQGLRAHSPGARSTARLGVLAPTAPLRTALTALAPGATTAPPAPNQEPATEPAHRRAARFAWALLLVRIYEVCPLVCPDCGGAMRIIAFITDAPTVRDILDHLGEPTMPPRIAPARGPPLWEGADPEHDPAADPLLQYAPAFEFDPRLSG